MEDPDSWSRVLNLQKLGFTVLHMPSGASGTKNKLGV